MQAHVKDPALISADTRPDTIDTFFPRSKSLTG